jgi:SAM-dependent methyltransferase
MTTPVRGGIANVDQADAWNGAEGLAWAAQFDRYDAAMHAYHTRLLDAAAIGASERVLDIGCGCGATTRDAARAASSGHAVGVDLSAPMLERARELAGAEGLTNVTFEQGDAQVYPFDADAFDVTISRFGAMFFSEPVIAFGNIARAMRHDGRLLLMVWQPLEDNEWLFALRGALAMGRELPRPVVGAPGPFGLADPDGARAVIDEAGFADVAFTDVREKFRPGRDTDDAFEFVANLPPVRGMLQDLDADAHVRALEQLREMLVAHTTDDGLTFDSAAWLITARKP